MALLQSHFYIIVIITNSLMQLVINQFFTASLQIDIKHFWSKQLWVENIDNTTVCTHTQLVSGR